MDTLYSIIGVSRSATKDEIRSAYIRKAKQTHPDAGGNIDEFDRVHQAYKTLGSAQLRMQYNAWLDETYKPCLRCDGRGILITTKSFKVRTTRPCNVCHGSGIGERK